MLRWRVTNAGQWLTEPNPALCYSNRSICTAARAVLYGTAPPWLIQIRSAHAWTGLGGNGGSGQEFHVQIAGRKELDKGVKTMDEIASIRRGIEGARLVCPPGERLPCNVASSGKSFYGLWLSACPTIYDSIKARNEERFLPCI